MKQTILLLLLGFTAGCTGEVSNSEATENEKTAEKRLPQLEWMLGRWENNSDQGNLSEVWKQVDDSTFTGRSYFVIQGDTVFAETIRLIERKGKISYCVSVKDQNNGEEVPFELTALDGKNLTFENPEHDYPSKITYTGKGNSMVAEISGMVEGKPKSEQFSLKKKK